MNGWKLFREWKCGEKKQHTQATSNGKTQEEAN